MFVEFLGKSDGVRRAMADVKQETSRTAAEGETSFQQFGRVSGAAVAGIGLAAAGAAAGAVKMAADFQSQMTRVRTGAGETAANMATVSQGVLAMAGQVGQSTGELTAGLYQVESAGYHGADALNVLKMSAMGAKVGAADLKTVADAVTTGLNAYKLGAGQAAEVTNALVAAEGQGKTTMEELAGSLSTILPSAAAAHVGLHEVLGAMSTMTSQGTPAAVAATYLRQTIGALENPSGKAAQEMKSLGLSSVQVSQNLGKNGLASTLEMLTNAIQAKMGPAGTVLIEHLQKAAKNTSDYQKVLANLAPDQQTYIGALATMVGGTKSMQAALELTGPHMADFKNNTAVISEHVKAGGKNIEGWADVQKNFNQKMTEAKASLEAVVIQIGQYLLPVVTKIIGGIAEFTGWLAKHQSAAAAVAAVIGGILVVAIVEATIAAYAWAVALEINPFTWIVLGIVALIAGIVLLVQHWKTVWAAISGVAGEVGHFIAGIWRWLAKEAEHIWRDDIAGPIMEVVHSVVGFFRKWWPLLLVIFAPPIAAILAVWNHCHKEIESVARSVWGTVTGFFSATWQKLSEGADFAWRWIKKLIITPITETWHELVHIGGQISDAVTDAVSGPLREVEHIGDQFLDVGHNIVMGVVHGIERAEHWVTDKIKNLAGDALNSAKSFLGISSPSKVMADEVGQWIPHGIAQGVADHAHVAVRAVAAMSAGLSAQTIAPGLAFASAPGAAGYGGGAQAAEVTTVVNLDGAELFRAVQTHALRNDRRNPKAGLIYVRTAH
ncbi:phage tail tape measure protein [Kitasatospora sp. GP82]|uniref:phage tail tape measure protein n=1 Tax=Kitasatospora sp. GP82 TaxID=3035089 RepID=UPI002475D6E0|nr:phage tail tape measure protein [Kitasatospora sp. GP82]